MRWRERSDLAAAERFVHQQIVDRLAEVVLHPVEVDGASFSGGGGILHGEFYLENSGTVCAQL